MENKNSSDSLISYVAATAPALLQLIAVLSIGLVNILKLDQFVLAPNFINIANFLTILTSVSLISLASFWNYNRFALSNNRSDPFIDTKNFWVALKMFLAVLLLTFLLFIGIVTNKNKIPVENLEMWTFIQWACYLIAMSSVSFIVYAFALLKIQERNNKTMQVNYIPRLLESLRRNGHVRNPDIIIDLINRGVGPSGEGEALVRFEGPQKYKVITDFTGEMISIGKAEM